jgi:hypothetical protein
MSRYYIDPDIKFFGDNHKDKPEGRSYIKNWQRLAAAERTVSISYRRKSSCLEAARRKYIEASDECSSSLSVLEQLLHWPS